MNNRSVMCLTVIILLVCVSCTPTTTYEVCDIDGHVYNILMENLDEWLSFYSVSRNRNDVIHIDIGRFGRTNAGSYPSQSGNLIIYIPTNSGIPASLLGVSGYFYTEGDPFEFDDRYQVIQVSKYTYCYERIR